MILAIFRWLFFLIISNLLGTFKDAIQANPERITKNPFGNRVHT